MEKIRKLIYGDYDPYENTVSHAFNGFLWGDPVKTAEILVECIDRTQPNVIVEVGSWIGGSAIMMGRACKEMGLPNVEIVCIDTWLGSVEHYGGVCDLKFKDGKPLLYEEFRSNMVTDGLQEMVTPFPIDSTNGLLFFKKHNIPVDFVYVDAGHDYRSVMNDLYHASQLLRPGGWLLGDDYHVPDIRQAVRETFGEKNIADKGTKFLWIK